MMDRRRRLPSVDRILGDPAFSELMVRAPRGVIVQLIRGIQGELREELGRGGGGVEIGEMGWYAQRVSERLSELERGSLRPVINATGVVLHTNLGRAPLSSVARDAVAGVSRSFSNLEYDLALGERGSRYDHCTALLTELTGAESALVVNNNAAALVLALNTLAEGEAAIVSRGELVEIGGGFRIPEIMAKSGARLVEVGSTNRTHLSDYTGALGSGDGVGAVLKVHRSNFRIEGFTAEVELTDLVRVAGPLGIPVINDLGSGLLDDLTDLGLPYEPTAQAAIGEGADLVTMSGDKLLGGPQAGIIVGRSELIERLRANPLCRAFRVDKLTLAALEATLSLYRDPAHARREVPVLQMLSLRDDEVRARARAMAERLEGAGFVVEVVPGFSTIGGGAYPGAELPTELLMVEVPGWPATGLERELRLGERPVVIRLVDGRAALDLRTVQEGEEAELERALVGAATRLRGQGDGQGGG